MLNLKGQPVTSLDSQAGDVAMRVILCLLLHLQSEKMSSNV